MVTADESVAGNRDQAGERPASAWYAVWTRSQCELQVRDDLAARGFDTFLPTAPAWVQRQGRRRRVLAPLFPGYLFLRHELDPASHADVLRARGVVRLLGQGPAPTAIDGAEIEAVRRLASSGLPLARRDALEAGQRVRVMAGPLAGLEGRYLRSRGQGLFLIAVTLLRRSVAAEVDAALVEVL